ASLRDTSARCVLGALALSGPSGKPLSVVRPGGAPEGSRGCQPPEPAGVLPPRRGGGNTPAIIRTDRLVVHPPSLCRLSAPEGRWTVAPGKARGNDASLFPRPGGAARTCR